MDLGRRTNSLLLLLLLSFIGFVSIVNVERTYADSGAEVCAVTPDQIDGQGFRTSSQGFRTSSQGFRTSSQGFRTSSQGFRTSSQSEIQAIIQEMLDNPVTPKLMIDDLPDIITGSGFNSQAVYLLVVDDFSTPNSHGYEVRSTIERLISAIDANDGNASSSPNISIVDINIADQVINYDVSMIAGKIKSAIDSLPNANNSHVVVNMSFAIIPCVDATNPTLVDSETGESYTVTNGFNFDQYQDGPPENPPFESLSPILECVVIRYKDDGKYSSSRHWGSHWWNHSDPIEGYTAYFGYYNPNTYGVEIPIGSNNKFTGWNKDQGQPTAFAPGLNHFVFSADFENGNLIWQLGNKNAKAWKKSPLCEGEIPEPPVQIFPQGYSLSDYFTEVLGVPEQFVDEYLEYLLRSATETEADPFANIETMMKEYLQLSYLHATDGDPTTNFALIPVASAGNFRSTFGGDALKPAAYDGVIAVAASVGDNMSPITFWQLSHDGNILAPGVAVGLAFDSSGAVTEIGAGTSHSAPFVSVLSSLWLTYPGACHFNAEGLPPLTILSEFKNSNAFFTENVLDCQFNLPPTIELTFAGSSIDENTAQLMGTISDPNGDLVNLSTESEGISLVNNGDGTWSLIAADNITPQGQQTIIVTANDGLGGISTTSIEVTILNVAPEAVLEVDKTTVDVLEAATLSLTNSSDQSTVDSSVGFTYAFDCDTSDEFVNAPSVVNTFGCAYASPGVFAATATIFDKDGGSNIYDTVITVESSEPETCYAESLVSYIAGRRRDGREMDSNRTDPTKALGAPQNNDTQNYVSLGFAWKHGPAGSIILAFGDHSILNQNGTEADVRIWETTYQDQHRHWYWYPEKVEVYASNGGEEWIYIGTTSEKDQAFDLGSLAQATQIKLVDVTNPWFFGRQADAFDVDAVEGFSCGS